MQDRRTAAINLAPPRSIALLEKGYSATPQSKACPRRVNPDESSGTDRLTYKNRWKLGGYLS
jgi:hypothetical protein